MSHEEPQPMPPEQEQPVSNRMGIRLKQPKEVGGFDEDIQIGPPPPPSARRICTYRKR